MPEKILVFTKVRSIAKSLGAELEKRGLVVSTTGSKKKMLALTSAGRADYLLVDASSDVEKGLKFCQQLRERDAYVRIILVVQGRRKVSLDSVDASFVAPITARKVLRRMKALRETSPRYLITVADIVLDPKDRVVRCGDHETHLTPKEARLLQLLMENAGSLVPREEIMRRVWDTEYTGDMRTIDVHVRWLRKKLEPVPSAPRYIRTVRGKGYRFEPETPVVDDSQD